MCMLSYLKSDNYRIRNLYNIENIKIQYKILIFLKIFNIKTLERILKNWNYWIDREIIFSRIDYRICILSQLIINPLRLSYGNARRANEDRRQKEQSI